MAAVVVTGSYNFWEVHVRPAVTSAVAIFYAGGYTGDLTENHAEAFSPTQCCTHTTNNY